MIHWMPALAVFAIVSVGYGNAADPPLPDPCHDDPRIACNLPPGCCNAGFFCSDDDLFSCSIECARLGGFCQPGSRCSADAGGCVPAEPCGERACPAGQVCCNPSCGICTPPGGACIQIQCRPGPDGD